MTGRLRAMESAALASSVTLVCRKRPASAGQGLWDDVRQELKGVAAERLDFFWNQGIRGADFFISAIGPALSVFGRYERVVRTSGERRGCFDALSRRITPPLHAGGVTESEFSPTRSVKVLCAELARTVPLCRSASRSPL
jgi:adenine-specific DNA methylase